MFDALFQPSLDDHPHPELNTPSWHSQQDGRDGADKSFLKCWIVLWDIKQDNSPSCHPSIWSCALQRLVTGNCTNAQRELLQFHWQCFGNTTARDCDIYQNLHTLFFRPICDWANWHRKSFESVDTPYCIVFHYMVNHMCTGKCPVALRTFKYTTHIVIQEVTLCNYLYTM